MMGVNGIIRTATNREDSYHHDHPPLVLFFLSCGVEVAASMLP